MDQCIRFGRECNCPTRDDASQAARPRSGGLSTAAARLSVMRSSPLVSRPVRSCCGWPSKPVPDFTIRLPWDAGEPLHAAKLDSLWQRGWMPCPFSGRWRRLVARYAMFRCRPAPGAISGLSPERLAFLLPLLDGLDHRRARPARVRRRQRKRLRRVGKIRELPPRPRKPASW